MTTIGVLALQGDFAEHISMLRQLDVKTAEVRKPEHLQTIDGLIIPGGESTAIIRLARSVNMVEPLKAFSQQRFIWGTCAGAILLAKEIEGEAPHLAAMDITVRRNAFGRQIDSFITELDVQGLEGGPLRAVFIRAPVITAVAPHVAVLARLADGTVVAARQGNLLATSFHPELTPDVRMHHYFCHMASAESFQQPLRVNGD
jgi:pyridoxal 5'-phosphate synthase pdxT subunit